MRIAIITLPLHSNYGGVLQAYALQTVLERMGHKVEIIGTPWQKKLPLLKAPISYTKRFFRRYILHQCCRVFYEKWYNKTQPFLVKNIRRFMGEYLHVRIVNSLTDLKEGEYDAFIVGSDQVWRPSYTYRPVDLVYLSFARRWNGVRRVAYAASFGTDKWEYTERETELCRQLAKLFDVISVREKAGIELCSEYLEVDAMHVLDPTMLLRPSEYKWIFEMKETPKANGTLLTYILDETPDKEKIVVSVENKYGLTRFRVNSKYEDWNAPLNQRVQPPVEDWIRGFYDAKFVVTDSFHATVFAILFGKPFVVIGNERRGISRFQSLLEIFDLMDHLVFSWSGYDAGRDYHLNQALIEEKLNEWRAQAMSFLKKTLDTNG